MLKFFGIEGLACCFFLCFSVTIVELAENFHCFCEKLKIKAVAVEHMKFADVLSHLVVNVLPSDNVSTVSEIRNKNPLTTVIAHRPSAPQIPLCSPALSGSHLGICPKLFFR